MGKTHGLTVILIFSIFGSFARARAGTAVIRVARSFSSTTKSLNSSYHVTFQCQHSSNNIVVLPVKGATFKWRIADFASGEAMTDNQGNAEFTYTSKYGKSSDTVEIEYLGEKYLFSSRKGLAQVKSKVSCL